MLAPASDVGGFSREKQFTVQDNTTSNDNSNFIFVGKVGLFAFSLYVFNKIALFGIINDV